ncbi:MAG: 4-hydroxy-tetrahydrodipicolinate reductase [Thermomicrobiales bacterium]
MTVRVGIAGIRGRMGKEIAAAATADPSVALVGGLVRRLDGGTGEPLLVVDDPGAILPEIDVLIDFTRPEGTEALAGVCAEAGVPLVCGTTGLDENQTSALRAAAARVPVFYAANMSPGVNAVLAVLPLLTRALDGYDIEIVETHHRYKADAPSGTALALGRAITGDAAALERRAIHGREGVRPRTAAEIGMHAVRGGGNPGEHAVIFVNDGEEVRVLHRAFSRAAYAQGAVRAARLIAGQEPGFYGPTTLPGFL